ncbi:MAG TPA: lipase maturation factor family protein [Verrucomicrobiae bacterium]|jgi:predicted DCC family thiol-disulfide oxidoreductase YuxK
MKSEIRIASPPPKPLMVFDGDCNFCAMWINRWRQITGEAVDYAKSQEPEIATRFPEIPQEAFITSVQLIEPEGEVFSGAEAVFRALAKNPRWKWPLHLYETTPTLAALTERAYKFVAGHRTAFSRITRLLWGKHVERPGHYLTRWLFLRGLGVIYLIAFLSLWVQLKGLIGHNGILPADQLMSMAKLQCNTQGIGIDRFRLLPTLCWFDWSDVGLKFQCAAGSVLAVILIVGIAPAPCLFLLWLIYLSLTTVGGDFLGFQWDNLLLETGFLSIFLAPRQMRPGISREGLPSRLVLWLLRILLFKLMFSSGWVKLMSGDLNWRNLSALTFHYETQPLPTWIAWYAGQAPLWFQKFSCGVVFFIEIGCALLIFAPRRLRFFGGATIVFLMIVISLAGNYTFFNWLTLLLCLLLLDDFAVRKVLPKGFAAQSSSIRRYRWHYAATIPLAVVFLSISFLQITSTLGLRTKLLFPLAVEDGFFAPLRTFNSYGLFAVMTTERREIIVEGSNDGVNWLPYEFKYKPGDVMKRPGFVAPHQPRLDWQMWFAALGDYRQNPWFGSFCTRLLQGSPDVLALMEKNPFPGKPPHYLRAELYDYEFTDFAERRATGAWWKRRLIGEYLPPVSLNE